MKQKGKIQVLGWMWAREEESCEGMGEGDHLRSEISV